MCPFLLHGLWCGSFSTRPSCSAWYAHTPSTHTVRGDVPKDTSEIFFRKVKFWKGEQGQTDPPPVFNIDGINYLFIKKAGLFMVCTTKVGARLTLVCDA